MNLILQTLAADSATLAHIAALSGATDVTSVHPSAVRCGGFTDSQALRARVDAACLAAQVDYAFVPVIRKLSDFKLLAMDMDSTLITIECIDEIADMHGLKPQVAAITEAAMRGEIAFNESLTRRVALLRGLDAAALMRVYQERLTLSPGAETMLAAVRRAGLRTLLVSGGFTFFTDRIRQRLELDFSHANQLEIVDGELTGRVVGTLVNAEEKRETVLRACAEIGATADQSIVMGDGANDLQMMAVAGLSVAFRAKPVVRAKADVALNFVGLDGILALFESS